MKLRRVLHSYVGLVSVRWLVSSSNVYVFLAKMLILLHLNIFPWMAIL